MSDDRWMRNEEWGMREEEWWVMCDESWMICDKWCVILVLLWKRWLIGGLYREQYTRESNTVTWHDTKGRHHFKKTVFFRSFSERGGGGVSPNPKFLLTEKIWPSKLIGGGQGGLACLDFLRKKPVFFKGCLPLCPWSDRFFYLIFYPHFWPSFWTLFLTLIFYPHFSTSFFTLILTLIFDNWKDSTGDTDYNSDNWEPEFRQSFLPDN